MHELVLALVFLAVMLGSTVAGLALRGRLPGEHVADASRDSLLRAVGLVVTLASLVLAFLVSSARAYYASVEDELTEISSDVAGLDRVLARYGPETGPARDLLQQIVGTAVRTVWPEHPTALPSYTGESGLEALERLSDQLGALPTRNARDEALRDEALRCALGIERSGFKLKRIQEARAQTPLLVIVVSWLVIIFTGFGLLTPRNRTALTAMVLAAVAATGALFLIVELYSPVAGVISIPPSILENSLAP